MLVWSTPLGCNVRVWVDFFGGLQYWQFSWYKGEKFDNKEWDLNYKYSFPRVPGYQRVCDIMEVDIMEFKVYEIFYKVNMET
jgi:hypothetical protein